MSDSLDFDGARRIILDEIGGALSAVDPGEVEAAIAALRGARRVFLVGVGRVCLALQSFAKRLNHLGIDAWMVGSVNEPSLEPEDLLVAGSGSGESLVPVVIARKAKDLGARILYLGASPASTIARLADFSVRIPGPTKTGSDAAASRQPMASLFEQALLLVGDAICLLIAHRAGADPRSYGRHANLEQEHDMSGRTMRAAVLHAPADLRVERVPMPTPGAADALVRVAACGICGSDVPRVLTTGTYHFPTIPGHEMAGVVEALGPEAGAAAPGVRVGMPVAVIPLVPCRRCRLCEVGAFAQCEAYDYLGSRTDGGFAEYLCAPAANLVPLPEGMPSEQGALLEPAAVALHAVRNLGLAWGASVGVFGLGAIGNFIAQWARAFGARRVFALDIAARKLAIAREVGLEDALDAGSPDLAAILRERTGGVGLDAAFDASGSPAALRTAIASLAPFGRLGLVGRPSDGVTLDSPLYERLLRGEITLKGTWGFAFTRFPHHPWEEAARAVAAGLVRTGPLVTHRITLEELPAAIARMSRADPSIHKILVIPLTSGRLGMLVEYRNVRQVSGEGFRRWFSDDYFDLIVWYEGTRRSHRDINGFQLCYDRSGFERALTWQRGRGFSHEKVDTGEGGRLGLKSTPILVADGLFDASAIAERFREASRGIDPQIVKLVLDRLAAYPGS